MPCEWENGRNLQQRKDLIKYIKHLKIDRHSSLFWIIKVFKALGNVSSVGISAYRVDMSLVSGLVVLNAR